PKELDVKGPEGFNQQGLDRGRSMAGPEVLAWWRTSSAAEREALAGAPPDQRVPWGIGMSVTSLVTARLMETWAHGLDVYEALGSEPVDTDRLRHVAWIGVRALPYAFGVAGREAPPGELRVELDLPSGARFTAGPDDAGNRITGPAGQFCRLFVQRITRAEAPDLTASGPLADAALDVARAYL
ncbi:MAG TPA: maleylpyruvate isomerase family mycothiol-dependent enzyme, partial [Acidimicrobiia bacterium]|nr:maleylpyruvate isomerase family mycothiol-dependent enzyme [Acidimicrobiia bacterium]